MKVFLTGGTGFIGGEVARRLRERGDEVVALVRTPARAEALKGIGCTLVQGSLSEVRAIRSGLDGADAVIHGAAVYEVGVLPKDRPAMFATNVSGTRNVLATAASAKVPRTVYVSSMVAFGNTRGKVVDETYEHDRRFTSYYDETKHVAHREAVRIGEEGLPLVIVQPGAVYGPHDHSVPGSMVLRAAKGKLPAMAFPEFGVNALHRDDAAAGILLALDAGRTGESYALGGEITTLGEMVATAAKLAGRKPPRLTMPVVLVKAAAPLGRVAGPLMGYPPNMRELISSSHDVTFWASDGKARRELGYAPRDLETGLRDLLVAEGIL